MIYGVNIVCVYLVGNVIELSVIWKSQTKTEHDVYTYGFDSFI